MNEIEILRGAYEFFGIWGFGIVSIIAIVFKTPFLRKKLFEHLFYNYIVNDDPKAQYTMLSQQIKYWIQSKGSILVFEDKGRQAIFQDLLHIKITTYKTYVDEFYRNLENFKSGEEMYDFVLNNFQEVAGEIEEKQKAMGIPQVAIEKYQLWQRPSQQYTLSQLRNIAYSQAFCTVNQKAEAMMGTFQTNIELSIIEAERTLQSLNGSLTGKKYKGFICAALPH